MTDFGPLLANPRTLFLGAAAQFGIFATVIGAVGLSALGLMDFSIADAAAIWAWLGASEHLPGAFNKAIGGPPQLRDIVYIPLAEFEQAVTEIRIPVPGPTDADPPTYRGPRAMEVGHVRMLRRIARWVNCDG